uniref:Uncharacterized protein n=1 Tax=Acrobeloides nanus TaxID=290746 RepID=A0A914DIL2_9BILA
MYAIVRGCYTTLMQGTSQSINIGNNNITCSYYTIPSISAVIDNNGNEQTGGVTVAVRFCNAASCNIALTTSASDSTTYESGNPLSYCTAGKQISCYSCSHFLTGKCTKDPSSTCTGVWCTKVEGKINAAALSLHRDGETSFQTK